MKAWLVREIGKKRVPQEGEYYLGEGDSVDTILKCGGRQFTKRSILSVTPVPSREEFMRDMLEVCITSPETIAYHDGMKAAYTILFGKQPEEYRWIDDWM